jgi:branched-chain amino acid transport system ATP-binding protein
MGGQKQLEVIRPMMSGAHLFMLDEPAAGLNDSETAELAHLLRAMADNKMTIVVIEHNLKLVMAISDKVVCIEAGRYVTSGSPIDACQHPRVIEAYIGRAEDPCA